MPDSPQTDPRELVLERVLDAPRMAIWRCWTEPELMKRWFCPPPWAVVEAELDVRPGGISRTVMGGPNGERNDGTGVYLEVVEGRRLIFTDAFTPGWVPSTEKPFMVGVIEMEDAGDGRTRYRASARHWNLDDTRTHEEMGFHTGWGIATDQLEALARTLG